MQSIGKGGVGIRIGANENPKQGPTNRPLERLNLDKNIFYPSFCSLIGQVYRKHEARLREREPPACYSGQQATSQCDSL